MSTLETSKHQLYFKQTLTQLKVGHDSHTKNYYKKKLYKFSIYSRYLHQCQPSL